MNQPFSYKELAAKIKDVFINQDQYKMFKHVEEFKTGNKFLGDYFIFVIFESRGDKPPTFYTVCSPFDLVTEKAPEQALVFENGELILNTDFSHYTSVRTGLMDTLVVQSVGNTDLKDKSILYIGTGKIAIESIKGLKEFFPELDQVDFYNQTKDSKEFGDACKKLNINTRFAELDNIGKYDFIFCHTSSQEPVLTEEHKKLLKKGVLITTFVSSSEKGEVEYGFYDTSRANVLMDLDSTPIVAKELQVAIDKEIADVRKIGILKDLFENKFSLNPNALYTIYRSTGTPMQNVAVLKLLLNR
ncbi:MAG TPA: hypothetical protein VNA13_05085 [Xanthomonadales bacterium]|nr:hypothetical protein [Xanthomonadales bacterium]